MTNYLISFGIGVIFTYFITKVSNYMIIKKLSSKDGAIHMTVSDIGRIFGLDQKSATHLSKTIDEINEVYDSFILILSICVNENRECFYKSKYLNNEFLLFAEFNDFLIALPINMAYWDKFNCLISCDSLDYNFEYKFDIKKYTEYVSKYILNNEKISTKILKDILKDYENNILIPKEYIITNNDK